MAFFGSTWGEDRKDENFFSNRHNRDMEEFGVSTSNNYVELAEAKELLKRTKLFVPKGSDLANRINEFLEK